MNDITVELGGTEYTIKPLPMRQARLWREKFAEPIQAVLGLMKYADNEIVDDENRVNMRTVGVLLSSADLILKSPDTLAEALFDYSPELRDAREKIEAEANDAEALAALWEVVSKLAYPFGSILKMLPNGPKQSGTSAN